MDNENGFAISKLHRMASQPREGIPSPWDVHFRLYYLPLQEQRGNGTPRRVKQHFQAEEDGSEAIPAVKGFQQQNASTEMILMSERRAQQLPPGVRAGTQCLKLPEISGICY